MTVIVDPYTEATLTPVRPADALDEFNSELAGPGGRIDIDRHLAKTPEQAAEDAGLPVSTYELARSNALAALERNASGTVDRRFNATFGAVARVVLNYRAKSSGFSKTFEVEDNLLNRTFTFVLPGSNSNQRWRYIEALKRTRLAERVDSATRPGHQTSSFEIDVPPLDLETEVQPVPTLLTLPNGIPFMPSGVVASLNATGGVGKTFLALELAVAVVLQGKWLGRYQVADNVPKQVLAVIAEEDREECRRRLRATCDTLGLDQEERRLVANNVTVYGLKGQPTPLMARDGSGLTDHHRALVERLEQSGPWGLVILDPQARFTGGFPVEKSNEDATVFVQTALEPLTRVPGKPTVLVLGHSSKESNRAGRADARGVTGQRDAYRWAALMYKAEGGVIFEHDKSNYTAIDGCRLLERLPCGLLRDAGAADGERANNRRVSRTIDNDVERDALRFKRDELARDRALPRVLAFLMSHAPATTRAVENVGGNKSANSRALAYAVENRLAVNNGTGRASAFCLTDTGRQRLEAEQDGQD